MPLSFQTIRKKYLSAAVITLNTLVLLVIVNLILWVAFVIKDTLATGRNNYSGSDPGPLTDSGHFYQSGAAADNGKRTPSNLAIFDFHAYEDVMTEPEISRMLDEFYDENQRGIEYQAWVQFAPRVVKGEFFNIEEDSNGTAIRKTPTNPPVKTGGEEPIEIVAFGGSTTLGAGVPDQHTWPSHLSRILNEQATAAGLGVPVHVTNYGRLGYFPTQELHFVIDILRSGQRPELVIFMDGVNLGSLDDTPDWTPVIQQRFDEAQLGSSIMWRKIPMLRAANSIRNRIQSIDQDEAQKRPPLTMDAKVSLLAERFKQSRESQAAICAQYGVESLFILQPDAPYNYPTSLHRLGEKFVGPNARALRERFYGEMLKNGEDFENFTGLFQEFGERKAIIDGAHYSPNFCKFLAEKAATRIDLPALKKRRTRNAAPTGIPRLRN